MNAFATFFGGAVLRSVTVLVWIVVFALAHSAPAQTKVVIDRSVRPLCHTDIQLIRVAAMRLRYKNWDDAVDAVNKSQTLAVCTLMPFQFRPELMLANVQVGNEVYEVWQVSLTAIGIEGQWRELEEPHTEYTLIPVHALALNPHIGTGGQLE